MDETTRAALLLLLKNTATRRPRDELERRRLIEELSNATPQDEKDRAP